MGYVADKRMLIITVVKQRKRQKSGITDFHLLTIVFQAV